MTDSPSWLIRQVIRLIPAQWRSSVIRDLAEEARRDGRGASWQAWHLLRIAIVFAFRRIESFVNSLTLPPQWKSRTGHHMFEALRVGLKSVVRRPVLAVAIVAPLALATAVSTALFSVADGLLFRPLPLSNVESTITVSMPRPGPKLSKFADTVISQRRLGDFQESFAGSLLFAATMGSVPGGSFDAEVVRETGLKASAVDIRFFEFFGLRPAIGRLFTEEDRAVAASIRDTNDSILPVILSNGFWSREFGANPSVVGQQAIVAGRRVSIVGVMPPGVKFPARTDIWSPQGRRNPIPGFAQLASGVTIDQVRTAFPLLDFASLRESVRPSGAGAVLFIFGTALSLLLLAWVQIGGLILTSTSDRLREIAVRVSLGASTGRIVAQFAAESVWLVSLALAAASLALPAVSSALIELLPGDLTAAQYLEPDGRALLFAALTTVVGFAVLTLAPLSFARLATPLLLMRGRFTESMSTQRVRRGLLIAQVACTALLLYVATLSAYSYLNVLRFDYGFDAENVLLIEPPLNLTGMTGPESTVVFLAHQGRVTATAERLRRVPGVRHAATIWDSPIPTRLQDFRNDVLWFDGKEIRPIAARIFPAGPDVIEALGATLVAGVGLSGAAHRGRQDVVVINETLAKQLSPIVPTVGKSIRAEFLRATVIGVIKDLVDSTPDTPAAPLIIQPAAHRSSSAHRILVRTSQFSETLMSTLRSVVEGEFGPLRSTQMRLLAGDVESTVVPWRGRAAVLGLVALLGLPLAIAGIASGLFFLVRTRARELGIRLALGATPKQARSFVLSYAHRVVAIGGVVGVLAGALAGRAMAGQLFGVGAVSVVTTIVVAGVVAAMAWIAAYIPARRASRVDPAVVLRAE